MKPSNSIGEKVRIAYKEMQKARRYKNAAIVRKQLAIEDCDKAREAEIEATIAYQAALEAWAEPERAERAERASEISTEKGFRV